MTQKYNISTAAVSALFVFALMIFSGCENTTDGSAVDYSFEEVVVDAEWEGEMGTNAPNLSLIFRSDGTCTFTVRPKSGNTAASIIYQAVYTVEKTGTALYSITTTKPEKPEDDVSYWEDEMKVSIRSTDEIGMATRNMNWATATLYRQ